ncbi:MAG: 50S ribosomal protein L5 [bacterium]|nr:50S ribosomal protein L5 [bacterium]
MKTMRQTYQTVAIPQLKEAFGYKSVMAVPKIEKVVINTSFGRLTAGKTKGEAEALAENILKDLAVIAGQKPSLTAARKSIASFKLRKGVPVGAKVQLRKKRMEDFLSRLIHAVLPRSRDFQGLSLKAVDEAGNLTIGIKEHIFFPEISLESVKSIFGLEVTIVTTAKSREEAVKLFEAMGFPMEKH